MERKKGKIALKLEPRQKGSLARYNSTAIIQFDPKNRLTLSPSIIRLPFAFCHNHDGCSAAFYEYSSEWVKKVFAQPIPS